MLGNWILGNSWNSRFGKRVGWVLKKIQVKQVKFLSCFDPKETFLTMETPCVPAGSLWGGTFFVPDPLVQVPLVEDNNILSYWIWCLYIELSVGCFQTLLWNIFIMLPNEKPNYSIVVSKIWSYNATSAGEFRADNTRY